MTYNFPIHIQIKLTRSCKVKFKFYGIPGPCIQIINIFIILKGNYYYYYYALEFSFEE